MNEVFEFVLGLTKNGSSRRIKIKNLNPTLNEKWFYFIEVKNINELEQLIKNGYKIDSIDENGSTIAHHAVFSRNKGLINFALKYKADFNRDDLMDVNPLKSVCLKNYSFNLFKKVFNLYSLKDLLDNHDFLSSLVFLVNSDLNLSKIKWLFLRDKEIMESYKQELIEVALHKKSIKIWEYLSGRDKLISSLNKKLKEKDSTSLITKL